MHPNSFCMNIDGTIKEVDKFSGIIGSQLNGNVSKWDVVELKPIPNPYMLYSNKATTKEILLEYIERVKLEVEANFRKVRHSFKVFESSFNKSGCSGDDFYKLTLYVFYISSIKSKQTQIHLMNKFEGLFQSSPWFKYSNPDNVKNLSSTLLTLDQLVALGYGLSFSLPPSKEVVLEFLTSYSKFEYFNTNNKNNKRG